MPGPYRRRPYRADHPHAAANDLALRHRDIARAVAANIFFFGRVQTTSPNASCGPIDLRSGAGSGAVVENLNLAAARGLDAQSHQYLASWSGPRSRRTLPGGCCGIPDKLVPAPEPRQA